MSHIVSIEARVRDVSAIEAACRRLNLPAPKHGTARLYSGKATGVIVKLPGWNYPTVIDSASGTIAYDNFSGNWGAERELHRFLQMYAVEAARIEAHKKGHAVTETQLQDGSIKLQIVEGS